MWKNRIRELRKQFGWTIKQMSDISGIGSCTINTWEQNSGIGKHIPERYYQILSSLFDMPINDIVWDEPMSLCSVDVSDWEKTNYELICNHCANFELANKSESFGNCCLDKKPRKASDNCNQKKRFKYKEVYFTDHPTFERSQIKCYCGNCIFYKIRMEQLRCSNCSSPFYDQAMPHSFICQFWEDSQGNRLPSCLLNLTLKKGIIKQRLKLSRTLLNKKSTEISNELQIKLEDWKAYESGSKAIPINELILYASNYNISFEWLVGIDDTIGPYKNCSS